MKERLLQARLQRREFIGFAAGAMAGPIPAFAQQPATPTIAVLMATAEDDPESKARLQAVRWATRVLVHRPHWAPAVRNAACANALAGNIAEARKFMTQLRLLDPASNVSNTLAKSLLRRPQDVERWIEGQRLAGLPE